MKNEPQSLGMIKVEFAAVEMSETKKGKKLIIYNMKNEARFC